MSARCTRMRFRTAAGASAQDEWRAPQRAASGSTGRPRPPTRSRSSGDATTGNHSVAGGQEDIAARSLTLKWNRHESNGGELQGQLYYDRSQRDERASGGGEFHVDTYDAEVQRSWLFGSHHIVTGAGARLAAYAIDGDRLALLRAAEGHAVHRQRLRPGQRRADTGLVHHRGSQGRASALCGDIGVAGIAPCVEALGNHPGMGLGRARGALADAVRRHRPGARELCLAEPATRNSAPRSCGRASWACAPSPIARSRFR